MVSEGLGFSRSTHPSAAAIFPNIRASRSSPPALPSHRPSLTRSRLGSPLQSPTQSLSNPLRPVCPPSQPSPVPLHRSAWPPISRVSAKTTHFTTGLRTDKMKLLHLCPSLPQSAELPSNTLVLAEAGKELVTRLRPWQQQRRHSC